MVLPHRARPGKIPHRPPRRTTTAAALALITVLATLLATSAGAAAPDRSDRAAPVLDPHDPQGAWAGYSIKASPTSRRALPAGAVAGMDVSGHQGNVDWQRAWADGARFTYVKATEGTGFRNDFFTQQYTGSYAVGMIRGAYHFALPDRSSGAEQAHYFVNHGGGWSPDGRTLPGAVDMEHNPYGDHCYGLDQQRMSEWLADFSNTYRLRTGRFPAIYTTTLWWNECTGGNPFFGPNNPLWVARYNDQLGALPAGWAFQTIWQFSNSGVFPGDQNTFNGNGDQLIRFAA